RRQQKTLSIEGMPLSVRRAFLADPVQATVEVQPPPIVIIKTILLEILAAEIAPVGANQQQLLRQVENLLGPEMVSGSTLPSGPAECEAALTGIDREQLPMGRGCHALQIGNGGWDARVG